MESQTLALTPSEIGAIMLAAVFLFIGLAACIMAAIRGRSGVRLLLWQGIFLGMYGARILAQVPVSFHLFPQSAWASRDTAIAVITYLILPPALLFWLEISAGLLRRILQVILLAAVLNAAAGTWSALNSSSPWGFMRYNNVLGVCFCLPLAVVNAVPGLAKRYMLIQSRILTLATSFVALVVVYNNLQDFLHLPYHPWAEPLSFAVFAVLLGYVAADKVFRDERRLLSLENELAIAREIQASTLPHCVPEIDKLRIYAAYRPMTAVAGDFYEFLPVDQNRLGILVADVSGHGVPAALIAAMLKTAVKSVLPCVRSPGDVLQGLNRMLSGQPRDQFVTAAYLFVDTQNYVARYSAAGHPPLLLLREGTLQQVESNGLVFGVVPEPDYPVHDMPIRPGDRLLLYTDGVIEPQNASGEFFGDRRLEQVVQNNGSGPPSEFVDQVLSEIRLWQPASLAQQDDITLIVIDVI